MKIPVSGCSSKSSNSVILVPQPSRWMIGAEVRLTVKGREGRPYRRREPVRHSLAADCRHTPLDFAPHLSVRKDMRLGGPLPVDKTLWGRHFRYPQISRWPLRCSWRRNAGCPGKGLPVRGWRGYAHRVICTHMGRQSRWTTMQDKIG